MNSLKEISASDALERMLDENTIVIDIRDEESFNSGHISGSINLDNIKFPLFVQDTPKDTPIIVVCYHGNSSQGIAQYLSIQGFTEAYSLIGGYEGWISSND